MIIVPVKDGQRCEGRGGKQCRRIRRPLMLRRCRRRRMRFRITHIVAITDAVVTHVGVVDVIEVQTCHMRCRARDGRQHG
jgi:hypothetical protein